MKRVPIVIALFLMPTLASAKWVLHQSDDGHWISGHNKYNHELVISQTGKQKKILLVLSRKQIIYSTPDTAHFYTDSNDSEKYRLKLIKKHPDGLAMQIMMSPSDINGFINQLVNGVNLHIELDNNIKADFSLLGFTTTFNDFLIANEIGRLDPMWLQYENRLNELVCYEVSQAMVHAMGMRRRGKSQAEVYTELSGKLSEESESALPDVVEQVFSVPARTLPRIPSTRKYEFFTRCMKSRQ